MSSLLYIPCSSLNKEDIESLVKVCLSSNVDRVDTHGGRKAAIKYILNIHSIGMDLSSYINEQQLEDLEKQLVELKKYELFKEEFDEDGDKTFEPYWELKNHSSRIHRLAKNARRFTNKQNGFPAEHLKIYFNTKQIDNIPFSQATFDTAGFVDNDARNFMQKYPIEERHNNGQINTKKQRIEKSIFDVPHEKQIIVLDFADERMPGGLFLYGASTQEETICQNSDTYRALLDFKYNRFDGGFMIPEFGCLYIKNVEFFNPVDPNEHRTIDVIVAACYDLTGVHGLHELPKSDEQIDTNTRKKFETIISAAQANTDGNGENTYLLLGPIGCGAFKNHIQTIAGLWAEVLLKPLNEELNTQQRHAFQHIWFVSGTDLKLKIFEQAFQLDINQRLID